ncbi:hypothetical protein Tco_1338140 [Tanacetum coccineum]
MNLSPKQNEVRHVINDNNLAVCAILESHIDSSRLDMLCKNVFRHWDWTSNSSLCSKGTRIILGWNADIVDTSIITQTEQVMHTRVWIKAERKELFCSFIYAHNRYVQRRCLWDSLSLHKCYIRGTPSCILGDFNDALNLEDSSVGSSFMDISIREFKECVEEIELMDVPRSGLQFTWNRKPRGTMGILKKLDRVMANGEFSDSFVGNYAVFQPYRISNHSPVVLRIPLATKHPPKTFKFVNVTTTLPRFELDRVQSDLDLDPFNNDLRDEEAIYVRAFMDALIMEEQFLKQKSKVEWLRVGDSNSAYLHKLVKGCVNRNRIDVVTDLAGDVVTGDGVPAAFVSHYEAFLGQQGSCFPFDSQELFLNRLDSNQALDMIKNVTAKEVKDAIFSMGNDKSLGPEGYTACFFKESWDIMDNDVILTVQEFFTNGKLLKELNHTIIALIPKVASPSRINDYRPISCCNVLFKCISKIISNHIKESLKMLISPNQSAFVSGRRIFDNILLTQELMHNYHLDRGTPRCAFKVDIQKAYDTVDWCFLKEVLLAFGFHVRMVDWIMECVTTTSYSLCINGVLHGYFKGKRSLRQGDPLSPYLFTIIMEVLTLMILRKVWDSESFTYHRHCSKLEDCKELTDRIRSRIKDWKNKSLSAAGRLQLVRSVIGSMHGDIRKGKAKVSWEVVCLPKNEGGLGLRRLELFNKALMVTHIWNLLLKKESLWVKWIHEYKLRGRHFFEVPYSGNMTWGWRKFLQLRPLIRDHVRYHLGDGATCSLWFDCWSPCGPLADIISSRDIHRAGFNLSSKIYVAVANGA